MPLALLFATVMALACRAGLPAFPVAEGSHWVTNVSQFRTLPPTAYLTGCDFHLTGVVTLVDASGNWVVLQDPTGAVALHFKMGAAQLQAGQWVTLDGADCSPYFADFPDFPFYPAGRNLCDSFETPMNWGEFNLTRMRGYLHPPVTGDYRFWIASDDSSELWLSTNSDPANIRKIASVPRFGWTAPHEWSKIPAQRSELVQLKAGETYYLEALQEQAIAGEHLSVAWQEPAPGKSDISVIAGRCLTPGRESADSPGAATNGALREYWTNYFAGDLEGLGGTRPYESALTVKRVSVTYHGAGQMPKPEWISSNLPLPAESNYRWVRGKGLLRFKSAKGESAMLEIFDGQALIQVRVLHWAEDKFKSLNPSAGAVIQVEGVCEGVINQEGIMSPGRIWVSGPDNLSVIEVGPTNEFAAAESQLAPVAATPALAMGYFGTRGVVTFNDQVFGQDYTLIQEGSSVWLISFENSVLKSTAVKSQLQVGEYIDLGGAIEAGRYLQAITPQFVARRGSHAMPLAIIPSFDPLMQVRQEGRWSELEGVVHAVNTNGTLTLMGNTGLACLWLGKTRPDQTAGWVDAKLRVRGVLLQHVMDAPLLLIPSLDFVDLEESPPQEPFSIPRIPVAKLLSEKIKAARLHRVRVVGEVTYCDPDSFFIQDESGGVRVQAANKAGIKTGDTLQVLAFPAVNGSTHILAEALVQPIHLAATVLPKNLELHESSASSQNGTLVQADAVLLGQMTNATLQILELQDQLRIFTATLATGHGNLPALTPGSRLLVSGVRGDQMMVTPQPEEKSGSTPFLSSLNILLRQPQDVVVLSGPPWWTWKRTVTLVGMLLLTLAMASLWVHLLRRRLEHQQAARLAFSQHVLGKLEEERKRIASNLHDSLGHTLLVIKNHALLAAQSPSDGQEIQGRMDQISGVTTQAIEEVRRIAQGLRPSQLDRLGLTETLRALVNRASENNSISFASRVEEIDGLFDKDAEIHLFRIVQEAITNIVKHSSSTEAAVVVKKLETAVLLSVRDNGRGFDPAELSARQHSLGYGITGITERVRILKGTLALDSRPGTGTRLIVEIPFKL